MREALRKASTPAREVLDSLVRDESLRRAAHRERAARRLVIDSLPRGFKWLVDHPRVLRAAKRLRLWRPPSLGVSPLAALNVTIQDEDAHPKLATCVR
jgi:hypothetical protein